jgi:hypothetical protein
LLRGGGGWIFGELGYAVLFGFWIHFFFSPAGGGGMEGCTLMITETEEEEEANNILPTSAEDHQDLAITDEVSHMEVRSVCGLRTDGQCCGAETICFGSGSDFKKVPEPAPATALELPVITDFMLKSTFFMFLMQEN